MSELESLLIFLSDPRLTPHAIGNVPAWLWSADASRVLWGNPAAAAIFNAASPSALAGHTIDPKGTAALQIARLAGTLPHGASPRLERLRGFGGRMGGALLCACSRIALAHRTPAILVVATEAAGPHLPLADQAKRLLTDIDEPAALFAADGSLLSATPTAQAKLGRVRALTQLNVDKLSASALASGRADGDSKIGKISLHRIGTDPSTVLLATFEAAANMADETPAPTPAKPSVTDAPTVMAKIVPPPPLASPPPKPSMQSEKPAAAPKAEPSQPAASAAAERRQPLRFVWQMDDASRFTLGSDEFQVLLGPNTAAALGRPWSEIAQRLSLDPEGHVARAVASHDTWSGISVAFPVDGSDAHLSVELSGLPVFDRDRNFLGYRGFGICRDLARMTELAQTRHTAALLSATRIEPPVLREEPPVFRNEPSARTPEPPAENIVPFPATAPAEVSPTLTPVERKAFSELANRLSARLRGQKDRLEQPVETVPEEPQVPIAAPAPVERPIISKERTAPARALASDQRPILDRLPIGVLVYRLDNLIYANRAFLDWTGYGDLAALQEAGGLDALFVEPGDSEPTATNGSQSLTIATNRGDQVPVEARLFSSPWEGESALVLMLTGVGSANTDDRQKTFETALRQAKAEAGELRAILDNAADGVVVLDRDERVLSINRGAEMMFGYASRDIAGHPFTTLFVQESHRVALDALKRSSQNPFDGRDVIGRRREGGLVALYMTVSRLTDGGGKLCATFRDMTRWKKTEGELLSARRQAEMASAAKSDFLAKISHEIRTPLNAIIGFSEVMMQERFGPIGNDRYRQYLKDIHTSGGHLVSLLNDLLDLSKIEAGKLELNFAEVDLNELTQETVAMMQPHANRERIIIRTSLPSDLPQVTADARSVRQIVLNLLSNSIKFTGAGGQVIVSTARSDDGEVVLRVRDTGIGMSEQDLSVALEPFRQLATSSRWGSSGTGLGLPLTKALAEANRARFKIQSTINTGTLVEVAFPGARMAAE
jgi:PAS domain S-box-containing protein